MSATSILTSTFFLPPLGAVQNQTFTKSRKQLYRPPSRAKFVHTGSTSVMCQGWDVDFSANVALFSRGFLCLFPKFIAPVPSSKLCNIFTLALCY